MDKKNLTSPTLTNLKNLPGGSLDEVLAITTKNKQVIISLPAYVSFSRRPTKKLSEGCSAKFIETGFISISYGSETTSAAADMVIAF